jgi:hypothetical protein
MENVVVENVSIGMEVLSVYVRKDLEDLVKVA